MRERGSTLSLLPSGCGVDADLQDKNLPSNGLLPSLKGETDDYPSSMPNERREEERQPLKDQPDHTLAEIRTRTLTANWIKLLKRTFPTSDPISVKITK